MEVTLGKFARAALAVALLALSVSPIATARTANRDRMNAKKLAALASQLASLKKQIRQLQNQILLLQHGPTSASPGGPAGGDLTGTYPNPQLGTGVVSATNIAPASVGTPALVGRSVTSAKLALGAVGPGLLAPGSVGTPALHDGSVTGAKLAPGSVTGPKLAPGAVGPTALSVGSVEAGALAFRAVNGHALDDAFPITGDRVVVAPGATREANVSCPQGARLLSGGFEWASNNNNGASAISSSPTFTGSPDVTWTVQGRVDAGGQANTLIAEALCING